MLIRLLADTNRKILILILLAVAVLANAQPSSRKACRVLFIGDSVTDGGWGRSGGSMKPSNAKELMAMRNIDGGLIGGAALKATDFAAIVNYKG